MKKRIGKYKQALYLAEKLDLEITDRETLYRELEDRLIIWTPYCKSWLSF